MTVFVGPKRALLGSVKPAWLGASGLWGFTASPTPQYAHFGRATNKAGALTSGRNGQALDFDADGNLVTAAANEPLVLPGLGLSNFRDYTNYAANWATPANQNVSLPATGNYTLAIRGTGSVAIAAGTATITGAGSATQAAPVAINCTATGTVSLTITGTVTYMWLTNTAFRAAPVVTAASPVARLADNTTIPQWQAFVERYSLLNGLTVSGTLNIDRLSAANNRTIFQAGSANEFARLDFTTGNRFRMTLQTLGPELRGNGVIGLIGTATAATYNTGTGAGTCATAADGANQSYVQWTGLASTSYVIDIENTGGAGSTSIRARNGGPSGAIVHTVTLGQRVSAVVAIGSIMTINVGSNNFSGAFTVHSFREVKTLTLESGVLSATGLYDISARFKPGDYALTVSGGVAGDTDASAETLPDAIRTEPAYVGRDIAGSLHWNGNIPSFKIGKAG